MFVGIFLVIGLGYWFFSSRGENVKTQSGLSGSVGSGSTTNPASLNSMGGVSGTSGQNASGSDFLVALVNLNNIELEDSVLSNPVWNYLFDFSVDLEPEGEAGRINPFAPIGSDGSILPAEQSSKVPSANLLNNGGAGALIN